MSHRTIYEDIRSVISLLESASGPMRFVKRDGPTTAQSGPDHALASLSAAQASEKGLLTSGTYGRTGSTSSRSAVLSTSLENRLRQKTDGLGSTLYKLTWKHWDLPSGRQICALRASVRRTSANDCGFMGPWPTPATTDHKGGYLGGRIRNGKWSTDRLDVTAQLSGWNTPQADAPTAGNTDYSRKTEALCGRDIKGHGLELSAITQPIRLTASGETLIGSDAAMESSGQLNPAHSRWLMGLPPVWDDCAVTAMQSLPRSRKHSSKQHKGGEK